MITAEAYLSGHNASTQNWLLINTSPTLATTQPAGVGFLSSGCDGTGFPQNPLSAQAAIVTDQNFGTLQYGDPFPSGWTRALSLCQEATVAIPIPGSSTTANFALVDGVTVAPSNAPLVPLVSQVQNPSINGGSLFTAAALNTTAVQLSWAAPATGAPYGYRVLAFV